MAVLWDLYIVVIDDLSIFFYRFQWAVALRLAGQGIYKYMVHVFFIMEIPSQNKVEFPSCHQADVS